MKKISAKANKANKIKNQPKIKSKNVTNNFILTPRTSSNADHNDPYLKADRYIDQLKNNQQKIEELKSNRTSNDHINNEIKSINTDHPRIFNKVKIEESTTGTHTPLLKRLSLHTDHKHKNSSPQLHSNRANKVNLLKNKKSKSVVPDDSNKPLLQKIIAVMIDDYKQGRIKQKQLQQTLVQLYQQKDKKHLPKKNKKKQISNINHQHKSNQMNKTTNGNFYYPKTEKKKTKLKDFFQNDKQMYQQRVLERKDFVNKIIIKGITTSLFLRQDVQVSNLRQKQPKVSQPDLGYHINTSHSIKEINQHIGKQRQIRISLKKQEISLQEKMAIKIQRAWRRYMTKKLLNNAIHSINRNFSKNTNYLIEQNDIFDEKSNDDELNPQTQLFKSLQKIQKQYIEPEISHQIQLNNKANRYQQLKKMIDENLNNKNIGQSDCLINILTFLNLPVPDQLIFNNKDDKNNPKQQNNIQSDDSDECSKIKNKRIVFLPEVIEESNNILENVEMSQQLELNSFTNKYSSKEVINEIDYYQENSEASDHSLSLVHSQASSTVDLKNTSIKNIDQALTSRQSILKAKRQKQIQQLTQKLLNNKLQKQIYIKQKQKIQKWFKNQLKQLKEIRYTIIKGCNDAIKIIKQEEPQIMQNDKSCNMLKCLSQKFLAKQNIKYRGLVQKQQISKQSKINKNRVECQANEDQNTIRITQRGQINSFLVNHRQAEQLQPSNKHDFFRSPLMTKQTSLDLETQYKFQQIQKNIHQDDLCDGQLVQSPKSETHEDFQNLSQLESQKFIKNDIQEQYDVVQQHQLNLLTHLINQNKKFKYLCSEDKQDICQFLFLDLILEMFSEHMPGHTKVMKKIESHLAKMKKLKKIPKGFKTNINYCKDYLRVLYNLVIEEHRSLLQNLSTPMGPSASEMLKYMRDEVYESDQPEDNMNSTLVLPLSLFETVSKNSQLQLQLERYYDDDEKQHGRIAFLKTASNINNKSLFDSLNEMLDHERPYGVWGKPFPWKKILSVDRQYNPVQQQIRLRKGIDKTIQCCSYLCGILVDKQQSIFGNHRISQDYVMQIREDRLSKMLANDLIENQDRWIFYDDQQTQINMDITKFVMNKLIKQAVLEVIKMQMK